LLLWAWVRLPNRLPAQVPAYLRYLSAFSIAFLTLSILVYALLPAVADGLESHGSLSPSHGVYRVGILCAWTMSLGGTLCAAFTRRPFRLVALVAGVMLVGVWFFVGALA
jgi:hypothetical protein